MSSATPSQLPAAALRRASAAAGEPKKIAALCTTYFVRSHGDNFVTRFLEGYWLGGKLHHPACEIASLYVDQVHRADVSRRLSMAYGFPIVPSIREALTLGTGTLAVDGVLLIAEHGDYPVNEKGQKLLPRYEFMEQVIHVFRDAGRAVPVFVDKHLSYDWLRAKQMYDWSIELGFPLLAGSSLPVAPRRPEIDLPLESDIEEVLSVGSAAQGDGLLFHLIEALQCFAERRRGGETGIRAVQMVAGAAVWEEARKGRWDRSLLDAALGCRYLESNPGRPEDVAQRPMACFCEYNDGLKATALSLGGGVVFDHLVAARLKGQSQPAATLCYLPSEHANYISPLVDSIARMILTGERDYPIERNLLTTGALAFIMESGYLGQRRIETPMLDIRYRATEQSFDRERRD